MKIPRDFYPFLLAGFLGIGTLVISFFLFSPTPFSPEGSFFDREIQGNDEGSSNSSSFADSSRSWPVLISTMTHLEGNWDAAATERIFFNNQADRIRYGMDLAEEYDALLTIESERPMAEGMVNFSDNILAEALERGHGVGTHCDITPSTSFSDEEIVAEFAARKELVDALVGEEENLGCSGGGGYSDWYVGAMGAGFSYLNGAVGFHYLALPLSERPEGWTDDAILRGGLFHDPAPQDEYWYFTPFLISEVGFTEDALGDLLLSDGSVGLVSDMAEVEPWALDSSADCPREGCTFDADDAEAVDRFVRNFVEEFDSSRPHKITFYLPTSAFVERNEEGLRAFFAALQGLEQEGLVTWSTQRGVYDVMMEYYASVRE